MVSIQLKHGWPVYNLTNKGIKNSKRRGNTYNYWRKLMTQSLEIEYGEFCKSIDNRLIGIIKELYAYIRAYIK